MLKQFLGFAAVGVTGAGVNFIIYNFLLRLFESLSILGKHNYIFALLISFSLSILWCFVFSRCFVFNSVDESSVPWHKALLRMYLSYAFTGRICIAGPKRFGKIHPYEYYHGQS